MAPPCHLRVTPCHTCVTPCPPVFPTSPPCGLCRPPHTQRCCSCGRFPVPEAVAIGTDPGDNHMRVSNVSHACHTCPRACHARVTNHSHAVGLQFWGQHPQTQTWPPHTHLPTCPTRPLSTSYVPLSMSYVVLSVSYVSLSMSYVSLSMLPTTVMQSGSDFGGNTHRPKRGPHTPTSPRPPHAP